MFTISHKELKEDLLLNFMTNTPCMIYGGIGIGKSMITEQVARDYATMKGLVFRLYSKIPNDARYKIASGTLDISKAFIFIDLRSATMDPSDIKGLPKLTGNYVDWLPDIIYKIASNPNFNGVLFFDEMNQAMPAVQSALYQITLDNTAGTIKLSDNCIRVGAGNRGRDKSNVNKMSLALSSRSTNVELRTPSAAEWIEDYGIPNNVYHHVVSYIQFKPEYLNTPVSDIKDRLNFANPRNWVRLGKQIEALDKLYVNKKKDTNYFNRIDRLTEHNIGGKEAITFSAYMRLHTEMDIQALIKDPTKIKDISIDRKLFALDMIAAEYKKKGKKLIEVIGELCKNVDGDIAMFFIKSLKGKNPQFLHQFQNSISGGQFALRNMTLFGMQ